MILGKEQVKIMVNSLEKRVLRREGLCIQTIIKRGKEKARIMKSV
jgi:hypothetical protein